MIVSHMRSALRPGMSLMIHCKPAGSVACYVHASGVQRCPVNGNTRDNVGARWLAFRAAWPDVSGELGLRLLEQFLNEELPIPVQFHVTT